MKLFTKISFAILGIIYISEKIYTNKKQSNQLKHDLENIKIGIENKLLNQAIVEKIYPLFDLSKENKFGVLQKMNLNKTTEFVLSILIIDLFMYFWHRINHENLFLSKFHNFHHLEKDLNSTSSIKFHYIEIIISTFVRLLLIPIGIDKRNLDIYEKMLTLVVVFNHSNIKISDENDLIIRKFIVSPNMHRIHHSELKEEYNSNYSSIFSFWDNIFNSYVI